MSFENALTQIKKKYQVMQKASNFAEILINEMLTPYNYVFVGLVEHNNALYLCDFENTLKVVKITNQKLQEILLKYSAKQSNNYLYVEYENLNSIQNFVNMLLEISEN